ncbi:hypothetical protein XENOCAPTIV_006159, partial [Xenoophorus captivus]
LESEAVQRLFLNKLIDVALRWNQELPKYPLSSSRSFQCSVHAIKNTRRKMEDKHVVLAEFNQLFGIQDEKQRIEDLGGCITFMGCWRVNGTYAVSRAIGDFDQKPYVSGDADSSTIQLLGDEDYVLLACDGFFDAVKPSEVPELVVDALRETGDPEGREDHPPKQVEEGVAHRVAEKLVGHAKAAGSSDNITVMVVFLCPTGPLLAGTGHRFHL